MIVLTKQPDAVSWSKNRMIFGFLTDNFFLDGSPRDNFRIKIYLKIKIDGSFISIGPVIKGCPDSDGYFECDVSKLLDAKLERLIQDMRPTLGGGAEGFDMDLSREYLIDYVEAWGRPRQEKHEPYRFIRSVLKGGVSQKEFSKGNTRLGRAFLSWFDSYSIAPEQEHFLSWYNWTSTDTDVSLQVIYKYSDGSTDLLTTPLLGAVKSGDIAAFSTGMQRIGGFDAGKIVRSYALKVVDSSGAILSREKVLSIAVEKSCKGFDEWMYYSGIGGMEVILMKERRKVMEVQHKRSGSSSRAIQTDSVEVLQTAEGDNTIILESRLLGEQEAEAMAEMEFEGILYKLDGFEAWNIKTKKIEISSINSSLRRFKFELEPALGANNFSL